MYTTDRDAFECATKEFVDAASKWGLTVSTRKSKGMVIGSRTASSDALPVLLEGGKIEILQDFTYLGSNITRDGEVTDEVKCHIGKTARALGCLQKPIFQNRCLSFETKRKVYGLWSCRCFCMEWKCGPSKQKV